MNKKSKYIESHEKEIEKPEFEFPEKVNPKQRPQGLNRLYNSWIFYKWFVLFYKQRQIVLRNDNKYVCNQCDYKYSQLQSLEQHLKTIHEGVRFPCNLCNFEARQKGHLNHHLQSIHEGVKYSCEHCTHKASSKGHLKRHIKSLHKDKTQPLALKPELGKLF